jgi:hypothetical protein
VGFGLPGNSQRPSPGSLLARWLDRARAHPDSFVCGVRVVDGALAGEGSRWRYRRSAVDRLVVDGVIELNHGSDVVLRIRFDEDEVADVSDLRLRPGYVVRSGVEQTSAARVLITCDEGQVDLLRL